MSWETLPLRSVTDASRAASRVADALDRGWLLAHPTETVYGFGCALDEDALEVLARLKRRLDQKPFLVLLPDEHALDGLAWTDAARALASAFWPGPLTLALRTEGRMFPSRIRSEAGTVAVRVPGHAAMAALLRAIRRPVTSSSANLPGQPPARDSASVRKTLREAGADSAILLLDAGVLPPSPPSTIVDCSVDPPRIMRAGAITTGELVNVCHDIAT
ncbi:MAG: threonylcarbamoyl-AMP synthase [Gemmatimonadetes bacterium]|nr:threonylcarbamoyl-AMP synthase [Gemmatimonadota bacterium]